MKLMLEPMPPPVHNDLGGDGGLRRSKGAGRWGDTPGPEGSTPLAHAAKDTTDSGEERNEY